jgi:formylglycine-generating enzyme required for sulfatase activity
MKNNQNLRAAAVAALTMAGVAVSASAQITIPTVTVGNVSNAADTSGYGAVAYSYNIGTYEVTNTQYVSFLNAVAATDTFGLYDNYMGSEVLGGIDRTGSSGSYSYATKSGFENKPVNYVSFWDATRFSNWLNNGQGSGSTETGSYTLGSVTNPVNASVTRNGGANWVVASENEWYKAAYYSPDRNGSGNGGYWLHATQSITLGNNTAFAATNGANYDDDDGDYANGGISGPATTDVGAYANAGSYYGTFDQGGNLFEWNETIISGSSRVLRGGSWLFSEGDLRSSFRDDFDASFEDFYFGFRVASLAPIPEPSTFGAAMGVVALGVVMMRRRKARGTL